MLLHVTKHLSKQLVIQEIIMISIVEDMIDHCSSTHNLNSCEIEA